MTLSLYLTIMVHFPESTKYCGAKHPGGPALALRTQPMAIASVNTRPAEVRAPEMGNREVPDIREVLRCDYCTLVQYRTSNSLCRRCHHPLDVEEPVVLAPQLVVSQTDEFSSSEAGLQVAGQVKEIRRQRHMSQRQLALRMEVPRTYISKIENGKAIPTLGSLQRLAEALEVDLSQLVNDARSRREDEVAAILADPFLAEIAAALPMLESLHRTLILGAARDASTGRRRSA